MEIDIRKAKDEEIESIRWGVNDVIMNMDKNSCHIFDREDLYIEVHMSNIDNLILALKKYKELYGGRE